MKRQKTRHDVWGMKHNCPNYQECPLCYGCRAYDPSYIKCRHCEKDRKKNICDRKKHNDKVLSMMIQRQRITV